MGYFIVQRDLKKIGFIESSDVASACKKVKGELKGSRVMVHPSLGCMNIYPAEAADDVRDLQEITWGPALLELALAADEE